jgi:hypothetical protein
MAVSGAPTSRGTPTVACHHLVAGQVAGTLGALPTAITHRTGVRHLRAAAREPPTHSGQALVPGKTGAPGGVASIARVGGVVQVEAAAASPTRALHLPTAAGGGSAVRALRPHAVGAADATPAHPGEAGRGGVAPGPGQSGTHKTLVWPHCGECAVTGTYTCLATPFPVVPHNTFLPSSPPPPFSP